jgi:hypothetical protein
VVPAVRNSSPSLPARDDGDHDPDIDLITLRRKQPSESHNVVRSREVKDTLNPHRKADDVFFEHPIPAAGQPENHPIGSANESVTHRRDENVDEHADRFPSTSTAPLASSVLTQGKEGSRFSTSAPDTLDPYLVHYLKSLRSQSSKSPKPVITVPNHPAPQDLDVDSLRPVDLRSNYGQRTFKSSTVRGHNPHISNGGPSGEPGVIPEHLAHDSVKALNLPSSGGKVIIPRALLVRLIEETINLSGAAIRGNDVLIERYSPTWHRFARLLRTSDLHKISTLTTSDRSDPAHTPETADFDSGKSSKTPERASQTTTPDRSIESINASDKIDSSLAAVTEREYIVLAIDSKKSRIISTRFSRLLDGSSETVPISTEDLLKVEYLDKYTNMQSNTECRYLSHLKPLEVEGFRITAVNGTGIVLSKRIAEDVREEDAKSGLLSRLLGSRRGSRL